MTVGPGGFIISRHHAVCLGNGAATNSAAPGATSKLAAPCTATMTFHALNFHSTEADHIVNEMNLLKRIFL